MTIKEVFNKIKKWILGKDETELLPPVENKISVAGQEGRKGFMEGLRGFAGDRGKQGQIDMEKDYLSLVEEWKKTQEEIKAISKQIELLANGVEFDEQADVFELAEVEREQFITGGEYLKEAFDLEKEADERKKRGERTDLRAGLSLAVTTELAIQEVEDRAKQWESNIDEYYDSAIAAYIESQNRSEIALTKDQEKQIQVMQKLMAIIDKDIELYAKILGMQHAAYSNALMTDKEAKSIVDAIERWVEFSKKAEKVYGAESKRTALETEGVTNFDRVLYIISRMQIARSSNSNSVASNHVISTSNKYREYIQNGGKIPPLDIFDPTKLGEDIIFGMSEEESERVEKEYERIQQRESENRESKDEDSQR